MKRFLTTFLLWLGLFLAPVLISAQPAGSPNFIVIMVDDLAFEDIRFYNDSIGLIETPNIDLLAANSARFTNFYVTPLCATSRASLLTGRHNLKTGVYGVHGGADFLNLGESTIAEGMLAGGYKTAFIGKWHSGKTTGYFPWDRGFEEAHMADLYKYYDNRIQHNGVFEQTDGYVETVMANRAIDFISANKNNPFFLYYCPITAHGGRANNDPTTGFTENTWISPRDWHRHFLDKLALYPGLLGDSIEQDELARLYGSIAQLDLELGRIFDAVDSLALSDETVIMLMSDNGPPMFNLTPEDSLWKQARCPMGMARSKAHVWENGIRSFLFVHRTGVNGIIPRDIHQNVSVEDIFPTVIAMAEIPFDPNESFDGFSFLPLLDSASWDHDERYIYSTRAEEASFILYDSLFELDANRKVRKPQPLLYLKEKYAAVRRGDFKLINQNMFDIAAEDHIEFHRSTGPFSDTLITELHRWWDDDIMNAPHSFEPPTFLIGKDGENVSTLLLYAAVDGSPGIGFSNFGSEGFRKAGDFLTVRFKVETPGIYKPRITIQEAELLAGISCKLSNGSDSVYSPINNVTRIDFGNMLFPAGEGEVRFELTSVADTSYPQLFRRLQKLLLTYQGPIPVAGDRLQQDLLENEFVVYPNPVQSNWTNLYWSFKKDTAINGAPSETAPNRVELYSQDGRLLSETNLHEQSSSGQFKLRLPSLADGLYYIKLLSQTHTMTEKVIIN